MATAGKELQVRCLRGSACARACFAFGRLRGCSVGMRTVRLATSRGPPPPAPTHPHTHTRTHTHTTHHTLPL